MIEIAGDLLNLPQLRSLQHATMWGDAAIER